MIGLVRVGGYRLRTTLGRRWGGYLAIVLLIGLVGGLAMGAIAGARRTQSSFPRFLKSTNPSDLIVLHGDSADDSNATDVAFRRALARLPDVKHVESATGISEQVLGRNGFPAHDAAHQLFDSSVAVTADLDGELFDQDRPAVLEGRLADPRRTDEMVMSRAAAAVLHLRVGDVVPLGIYTNAQTLLPTYGTDKQTPVRRVDVKLVGIVAFNFEIVRDDFDRTLKLALLSPALMQPLTRCCTNGPISGVQLDHGTRDDTAVEAEIRQDLPGSTVLKITAVEQATAERAIAPQSTALGVFGAIAALAAFLIAGQAIGRQLRAGAADLDVLRALGASPGMTLLDGLTGIAGAIIVGSVLAAGVAVLLSSLTPLGPVRPVYPAPGIAFDWTVVGFGTVVLVVVLGALAVAMAYRLAPQRVARKPIAVPREARIVTAVAASGLSVSGVAGFRLALDPGRDKRAVPVRSAILGAALAVVVIVATVVFGSSLNTLVSHPALYGWNWDYELLGPYGGLGDVAQPQTGRLLDRDPYVQAWAYASFDALSIDGQTVPVLGTTPSARVAPPVLSGHAFERSNEIVLGAITLAALHKRIGDTVVVDNRRSKPTTLVIVGTATLPAIGQYTSLHLEIGTGAVLSQSLIPPGDLGFFQLPQAVLIRMRADIDAGAGERSLVRIANEAQNPGAGPPSVVSVERPAEIVNYRTMGDTPALLGGGLAAGAVAALGLTLLASVRRRRRDLALFKTLGFTRRQLAAVVAWQASIAVTVGVVVGLPLGVVTGRLLWNEFARALHVVPEPTVPGLAITLVALGALVLANVVAALPGIQAARTRTALLLRAD